MSGRYSIRHPSAVIISLTKYTVKNPTTTPMIVADIKDAISNINRGALLEIWTVFLSLTIMKII